MAQERRSSINHTPEIIVAHGLETQWADATYNAPFIRSLASGTLSSSEFDTWLVQDYLFVHTFTYVTARARNIIPEAQDSIRGLLGDGYAALLEERRVFRENAESRQVSLPFTTEPEINPEDESKKDSSIFRDSDQYFHPECLEYAKWMVMFLHEEERARNRKTEEYLLFLWTIEKCYYEAFLFVKQSENYDQLPDSIKSFVEWLSSDNFKDYINALENSFHSIVEEVDNRDEKERFRQIIAEILRLETLFWASSKS